jgi:methanogenic corrinoid protein MtbC1
VYLDVVIPAQRQVGEMWHRGDVNVAEEHFTTVTSQSLMAVVSQRATPAKPNGRVVVCAAVAGDAHDIAVRTLADLFELAGWKSIFLGADVPNVDLAQGVDVYKPDLIALAASLPTLLPNLERAIDAIRQTEAGRKAKIVVGGRAFLKLPQGHARVGADALAQNVSEAVRVGSTLAGLNGDGAG